MTPVAAWASIVENPKKRATYIQKRGLGGFVRATWDEVNEIIAAANVHTIKTYGPDRVFGFSPIPAMSMVSYAAGARYLSLIGGVCMSFYDWYCDLPPSSPQTWGEQTDVPEVGRLVQFRLPDRVGIQRPADAHARRAFLYRGRATSGTKSVVICPDYSEASKFADLWISPKQGTDAALAHGDGPCHPARSSTSTGRPILPRLRRALHRHADAGAAREAGRPLVPDRFVRASDFDRRLGETNNPEWKTVAYDEATGELVVPRGLRRLPLGREGQVESRSEGSETAAKSTFALSLRRRSRTSSPTSAFPYFGNREHDHFAGTDHPRRADAQRAGARRCSSNDGEALVATVFDLFVANYGLDRGFGGEHVAKATTTNVPYTPAWEEKITGVPRDQIITVAREFARNAEKTNGRSMVIIGAGHEPLVPHGHELPRHHQHAGDVRLRRPIRRRLVALCRPGKAAAADRLDAARVRARLEPPAAPDELDLGFFYAHTDQWRYETLDVDEILSPTAPAGPWDGALIDYNVRAERMGWLPSAPQLQQNPLDVAEDARKPPGWSRRTMSPRR